MPKFINDRPGILGLSWQGEAEPRSLLPGEVFEAEREQIPEHFFRLKWIREVSDQEVSQLSSPSPPDASVRTPDQPARRDTVAQAAPLAAPAGSPPPGATPATVAAQAADRPATPETTRSPERSAEESASERDPHHTRRR